MDRNSTSYPTLIATRLKALHNLYVRSPSAANLLRFYQFIAQQVLCNPELATEGARGLLLYLGMGFGKTRTAVAVLLSLLRKREAVVLLPKSLQKNFQTTLDQFIKMVNSTGEGSVPADESSTGENAGENSTGEVSTGESPAGEVTVDDEIPGEPAELAEGAELEETAESAEEFFVTGEPDEYTGAGEPGEIDADLLRLLRGVTAATVAKRVAYVSMDAYNSAEQLLRPRGAKPPGAGGLDGKLLIVDEAHNLFRAIINSSAENNNARRIYEAVMGARNLRVIFLTGTPIVKDPFELVPCMNMLAGYELLPTQYDAFYRLYVDRENHAVRNPNYLKNRLVGMVSHVSHEHRSEVGGSTSLRQPGDDGWFPVELPVRVERLEMGEEQYRHYLLAREREDAESRRASSRGGDRPPPPLSLPSSARRSMQTYFVNSRMRSNFVPPREYRDKRVEHMPDEAFTADASPKMALIARRAAEAPGPVLVYSQFVGIGGLQPLTRYLEALGFVRYSEGLEIAPAPEPGTGTEFELATESVTADSLGVDTAEIIGGTSEIFNRFGEGLETAHGAGLYVVFQNSSVIPELEPPRGCSLKPAAALWLSSATMRPSSDRSGGASWYEFSEIDGGAPGCITNSMYLLGFRVDVDQLLRVNSEAAIESFDSEYGCNLRNVSVEDPAGKYADQSATTNPANRAIDWGRVAKKCAGVLFEPYNCDWSDAQWYRNLNTVTCCVWSRGAIMSYEILTSPIVGGDGSDMDSDTDADFINAGSEFDTETVESPYTMPRIRRTRTIRSMDTPFVPGWLRRITEHAERDGLLVFVNCGAPIGAGAPPEALAPDGGQLVLVEPARLSTHIDPLACELIGVKLDPGRISSRTGAVSRRHYAGRSANGVYRVWSLDAVLGMRLLHDPRVDQDLSKPRAGLSGVRIKNGSFRLSHARAPLLRKRGRAVGGASGNDVSGGNDVNDDDSVNDDGVNDDVATSDGAQFPSITTEWRNLVAADLSLDGLVALAAVTPKASREVRNALERYRLSGDLTKLVEELRPHAHGRFADAQADFMGAVKHALESATKKAAKQFSGVTDADIEIVSDRDGVIATLGRRRFRVGTSPRLPQLRAAAARHGLAPPEIDARLVCCAMRYAAALAGSQQLGLSRAEFARLKIECEGFASPFNARTATYCSLYLDTDAVFGSLGDFFALPDGALAGRTWMVNPPFIERVMERAVARVVAEAARAAAAGDYFRVFVLLPRWDDAAAVEAASACPQLAEKRLLAAGEYQLLSTSSTERRGVFETRDREFAAPFACYLFRLESGAPPPPPAPLTTRGRLILSALWAAALGPADEATAPGGALPGTLANHLELAHDRDAIRIVSGRNYVVIPLTPLAARLYECFGSDGARPLAGEIALAALADRANSLPLPRRLTREALGRALAAFDPQASPGVWRRICCSPARATFLLDGEPDSSYCVPAAMASIGTRFGALPPFAAARSRAAKVDPDAYGGFWLLDWGEAVARGDASAISARILETYAEGSRARYAIYWGSEAEAASLAGRDALAGLRASPHAYKELAAELEPDPLALVALLDGETRDEGEPGRGYMLLLSGAWRGGVKARAVGGGQPRYAVISGEVPAAARESIRAAFNAPENSHGVVIKAILVSKTGAEGLDLRWLRETHQLEPFWDMARDDQVKSRAVRMGSHDGLPREERVVQPYLYVSTQNSLVWRDRMPANREASSIDEKFHARALDHYQTILAFRRLLGEVCLECALFEYGGCRTCAPTGAPLFSADAAGDVERPDPCEPAREFDITAAPVPGVPGVFYAANPLSPFGYSFYENSEAYGGFVEIDAADSRIGDLVRAVPGYTGGAADNAGTKKWASIRDLPKALRVYPNYNHTEVACIKSVCRGLARLVSDPAAETDAPMASLYYDPDSRPCITYRPNKVKLAGEFINLHRGQRKLFVGELQFLSHYYAKRGWSIDAPAVVVYAGAACGSHLLYLSSLFPGIDWHLYDPNKFAIRDGPKIHIYQQLFTESDVERWSEEGCDFFISDIRLNSDEFETQVGIDMQLQQQWTLKLQPRVASSLKFRPPYVDAGAPRVTFEYLSGRVAWQAWAPRNSTEGRLYVEPGAQQQTWDASHYQDVCAERNVIWRPWATFEQDLAPGEVPGYDRCLDCVTEVAAWKQYFALIESHDPSSIATAMNTLSKKLKQPLVSTDVYHGKTPYLSAPERALLAVRNIRPGV